MKKVLFVAIVNPFSFGGGSQATHAYLDAVIDIYGKASVDVLAPVDGSIPEGYEGVRFITVDKRPLWKSLLLLTKGVLGRMAMAAVKQARMQAYDIIVFNGGRESGYCMWELKDEPIRKITIHHNQEVEYCMDNKHFATLWGYFPYIVRKMERMAYKYSNINLFLTQQDMDAFAKIYGVNKGKNCLVGTFDFKAAKIINPQQQNKEFDLVASGSLGNYQTTHGVVDFYNRYLCIAKRLIPELRVLLTGRNPSTQVMDVAKESKGVISIVPSPEDIHEQVIRGRIYLCPTDIGGGLKLRAMDGLKNGLPVLVHSVSARGYDFFHDKPYFKIYNDEKSFEAGLRGILAYIKDNPECSNVVNSDYYMYFGYKAGFSRIKNILDRNEENSECYNSD